MSYARVLCVGLVGVAGHLVEVEADLSAGLPALVLTGLPDTALNEARDRVRGRDRVDDDRVSPGLDHGVDLLDLPLRVRAGNSPAIALYESRGFRRVGTFVSFIAQEGSSPPPSPSGRGPG